MQIECVDNGGFEDLLTPGQKYHVAGLKGQSVKVQDDTGTKRWFGRLKFGEPRYTS